MPRGLFRIEWCLILIIIIIPVVTYIINIIININLIFFIIILLIYIITIFLWVILLLVFMTATFGSYWLINKLSKCIKGSRLFYTYNMPTLPNCQGVSQTQNKTLGLPYGSSNLQDKRGFGSVPHRNITFELQISHI